ncbi:hypothetical protein BGZ67_001915 [Mortierella alpina]|nr:hypothetical protein BGZ67_001915 [Mortierella alpina]
MPSDHNASAMNMQDGIPRRHLILLLSGLGLMISYAGMSVANTVDRSNMAVTIVAIASELHYSKSQQGIILASFFIGYILTPIVGGTLADRYGGKAVLAFGAAAWTIFTLLTPFASEMGLAWVVAVRIALGLGEGVAYPSVHAMIGTWIPPCERSKAVATVTAFAYLGAVIALPTSSALVVSPWGWRGVFWLFGTLGLLWSIAWQFCNSIGFFVMQSWIPTFYLDFYGVDVGKIGYYAVLPSAVQGFMGFIAGYLGDLAIQDWNWTPLTVRRVGQTIGGVGLGVFLLLAVNFAHTAALAMALITIGMALNGFTMIGASAYQHDFCPQHAGFIFSLGNTAGSLPALIGIFVVGLLLDKDSVGRWGLIWTTVCVFYFLGSTVFVFLATNRRYPQ